MSKKDEAKHRTRYTLEFKLEAVWLVKAGQEASVTARFFGHPEADPEQLCSAGRQG
jgi:transposase-like protein